MKTGCDVVLLTLAAGCKCFIHSLLLFCFSLFFLIFLPTKGVNSSQSGEICIITFDTEGSKPGDGVSCKPSVSPQVIDDSTEHQKEPNQSQVDTKPQSGSAGVEDEFTETERQVPDTDAADETGQGCNAEKEKGVEQDMFKGSQEIPDDSQVVVEDRKEQEALHKSSTELGDPSGRWRSDIRSLESSPAAHGEQTCGPVPEAGVDEEETEQTKADVGADTQSPEEAKLKDEDRKEDNAERPCSAVADSRFAVSKYPESLISRKKDHIWKRECRSFRHLKVLQTAAVAFL